MSSAKKRKKNTFKEYVTTNPNRNFALVEIVPSIREKENPGSNEKQTFIAGVEIIHDRIHSVPEGKQPEELELIHEKKMFSLLGNESSMEKENTVPIVKETSILGVEFTHDRKDPVHEVKKIEPRKRFVTTKFECAVCKKYFAYKKCY